MMDENKKSYYAVIPACVRYDEKLPANAKLLYGEITALTNEKGYCWASNAYFAKLYNVTPQTVSNWIALLKKQKHITIKVSQKDGNSRKISIKPIKENIDTPINENLNTSSGKDIDLLRNSLIPIKKNLKHNITFNTKTNNTINNGDKSPDPSLKNEKEDMNIPTWCISLAEQIYLNASKTPKKHELEAGAKVLHDIERIDGYKPDEIQKAIEWGLRDKRNGFNWSSQLKSPARLRNKRNGAGDLTKFENLRADYLTKNPPEAVPSYLRSSNEKRMSKPMFED